jgi:hypothetical protein
MEGLIGMWGRVLSPDLRCENHGQYMASTGIREWRCTWAGGREDAIAVHNEAGDRLIALQCPTCRAVVWPDNRAPIGPLENPLRRRMPQAR